ncbi:RluA family pseudouridine synthase [Fusobacterium perfoetens]|uniref:RluA family pseudouridine synthase n=1 Tax=Fusobacterium perfoetens TaxID=852 RepID=UPI0004842B71|nr:RluA family pseudouridine synthase [Fusobacterium perfoetens]MCI6153056.1 RluA family pseudouridine synthase [Fusobacterium perfoetens]MDY3237453.1 RluA family pseudouridine synthase [Fusobacterium perfoetens]
MKKFIIEPENNNLTVGEYLKNIKGYSTRNLRNADIYLNNKKVKLDKKIKKLNRLIVVEKEKGTNIEPIEMPLDIVYEDKNLLIINKEPQLVVHPTQKKVDKTLANGIVYYFLKTTGKTVVPRFYNRLDMDTSGLIVITKNAFTQAFLQDKAKVKKYYLAIVDGIVEKDEFLIEKPIGRVGDNIKREELALENGGQEAKTLVKVLKRDFEKNISLIELELFTGRTHQIRVHMSLEGHPIVGDSLYGPDIQPVSRQFLHAYKLIIKNPETLEDFMLEIPLPKDMNDFLNIK